MEEEDLNTRELVVSIIIAVMTFSIFFPGMCTLVSAVDTEPWLPTGKSENKWVPVIFCHAPPRGGSASAGITTSISLSFEGSLMFSAGVETTITKSQSTSSYDGQVTTIANLYKFEAFQMWWEGKPVPGYYQIWATENLQKISTITVENEGAISHYDLPTKKYFQGYWTIEFDVSYYSDPTNFEVATSSSPLIYTISLESSSTILFDIPVSVSIGSIGFSGSLQSKAAKKQVLVSSYTFPATNGEYIWKCHYLNIVSLTFTCVNYYDGGGDDGGGGGGPYPPPPDGGF